MLSQTIVDRVQAEFSPEEQEIALGILSGMNFNATIDHNRAMTQTANKNTNQNANQNNDRPGEGENKENKNDDRLFLAALQLAHGSVGRLQGYVTAAKGNYQTLLVWAAESD